MFLCLTSLFHSVLFASSKFEFSTNKPLVDFSLISHDISQLIFNIKYSNSTNSPFRVIRGKVVWRKISVDSPPLCFYSLVIVTTTAPGRPPPLPAATRPRYLLGNLPTELPAPWPKFKLRVSSLLGWRFFDNKR